MTKQQAYKRMLDLLVNGVGVLTTSGVHDDLPTIQDVGRREGQRLQVVTEVRHAGMGLFLAQAPFGGKDISFDGGGAMQSAEDEDGKWLFSFTPLRCDSQEQLVSMGYDYEAAIAAVEELKGAQSDS